MANRIRINLSTAEKSLLKLIDNNRFFRTANGYRARGQDRFITLKKAKALQSRGLIVERQSNGTWGRGAPFLSTTGFANDLLTGNISEELLL